MLRDDGQLTVEQPEGTYSCRFNGSCRWVGLLTMERHSPHVQILLALYPRAARKQMALADGPTSDRVIGNERESRTRQTRAQEV